MGLCTGSDRRVSRRSKKGSKGVSAAQDAAARVAIPEICSGCCAILHPRDHFREVRRDCRQQVRSHPDRIFRLCRLYTAPPAGATVLCVDEKTCIQAVSRRSPGRPAAPGRLGRFEFEYKRHGTMTLLAALDIRTGKVYSFGWTLAPTA